MALKTLTAAAAFSKTAYSLGRLVSPGFVVVPARVGLVFLFGNAEKQHRACHGSESLLSACVLGRSSVKQARRMSRPHRQREAVCVLKKA